jgi:glycosyltransferase involved in cell wall biosynthesis
MKKPKLALFHCWFVYSGGGERIVFEQALGLRRRGYDTDVYATYVDPSRCFPNYIEEVEPKSFIPQVPSAIPLAEFFTLSLTSLLAPLISLRFREVDLFIGENQPGAWLAYTAARVLKKPYLVYLNQPNRVIYPREIDRAEISFRSHPDWKAAEFFLFRPLIRHFDMLSIQEAGRLLTNGSYIGNIISHIYQKDRVDCPAGCHPQPKENLMVGEAYKGSFQVNEKEIVKPYLLIAGRHEPQKKFEDVIQALAAIKKQPGMEGLQLVIPGAFSYHTRYLVDLAERLGVADDTLLLGQVSEGDLQRLYREAAVHCYPSHQEDFGMSPLEAGAWGVPTVAWGNAGPTVTVCDGETGFLAKPFDLGDYTAKILTLLAHPEEREKMGRAAWEWVGRRFSWERHVDILEKEIVSTLSKDKDLFD